MVEGHSVHRVAARHSSRLVGKIFDAVSPNGRFADGAKAIHGKKFDKIEAVGKNLFAYFGSVVVHVHFGMSGVWSIFNPSEETVPEPKGTTRLRLVSRSDALVADLSAMTVQHGGQELYDRLRSKLGEDPLREDADPNRLWERVSQSKKSIGALIMDQSFFCGPGNIYRAEILFKAGVHPDVPGKELSRADFDCVWAHTVDLLQRGFKYGSILTVDPQDAKAMGNPTMRRYIYNKARCPRCNSNTQTWQIQNRTCYACPVCQPRRGDALAKTTACVPFNSKCAPESIKVRLGTNPSLLTVVEIKKELLARGIAAPKGPKRVLVDLLNATGKMDMMISAEDAAAEKAAAGENRAVEHVAELAPSQTLKARQTKKNRSNGRKRTKCTK